MLNDICKKLSNSEIDKYRPLPFWSWNDKLEEDELVRQIKWMKESGFGGFFMHARGGLLTEYLSDEWFKCIETCVDEAYKLGLQSWAYDENGWPSGFAGGKLLSDPDNCDRYLTHTSGKYDKNAFLSYDISGDNLIRVKNEVVDDSKNYLNIYIHTSVSTVDILNKNIVKKFINLTHEEYKKRLKEKFSQKLVGFFTDEPQYYRPQHPYTNVLPKYFMDVYGIDLYDKLGLMFVEKNGYKDFRYKYWKSMQTLMLESFSKQIYEWCENNGIQLTGHYLEERSLEFQNLCCGGIMPFYEYEHIPGIDLLGDTVHPSRVPRQVSSVATQLGKKLVLTESFAGCGWDVTPRRLKTLLEGQFVNGVNLLCQHLLPYSESGQRKRDYPIHFSPVNPWVKEDIKTFNDYSAKLGYLIGESKEKVNVAVFCPMRSLYFDFKNENFLAQELKPDISYMQLTDMLSQLNIPYHILDENIMRKYGKVDNGKLIVGNCTYEYVLFPHTITMDESSRILFEQFFSNGGKMLFSKGIPTYCEGQEYSYSFKSNTSIEEIIKAQDYTIDNHNTEIQSTLREIDGKKFIFATNLSTDKNYVVTFLGNFNSFDVLDLETLQIKNVSTTLKFNVGDSYVLFLSDKQPQKQPEQKEIVLRGPFDVSPNLNYMTLDKLSYSFDDKNYSPKMKYAGVLDDLLHKKYNGIVYLKYDFEIRALPNILYFLFEDMNNIDCTINGNHINISQVSDIDRKVYKTDISKYVKLGINEVILKIHFYEKDNVYYVLFDEHVDESLKNCLVYDTTIESCYLQGDFGVYSDKKFINLPTKNYYSCNNFYIGEQKTHNITNTITDGYIFFAGKMTFIKKFELNETNVSLHLKGVFCLSKLKINGVDVPKSYFANKIDISQYAKRGENIAEITLFSGNRNFLGPFHYPEEDTFFIAPTFFTLQNTWKDGKSTAENDDYSFERFGLFE